jgi:hypothetical protein
MMQWLRVTCGVTTLALLGAAAQAAPIVHEPFAYETATVEGQTGGTGWGATWKLNASADSTATVNAASLAPPTGNVEPPTGGSAALGVAPNVSMYRNFAAAAGLNLDADRDIYVSFLAKRSGSIAITLGEASTARVTFGTSSGGNRYVGTIGTQVTVTDPKVAATTVHLFVLKIAAKAGAGTDQLFLETYAADVPETEPTTWAVTGNAAAASGNLTRFTVAGNAALEIDEIRIGTDWQSVTGVPVPEPATTLPAALLGIAACVRRRRRTPSSSPLTSRSLS